MLTLGAYAAAASAKTTGEMRVGRRSSSGSLGRGAGEGGGERALQIAFRNLFSVRILLTQNLSGIRANHSLFP